MTRSRNNKNEKRTLRKKNKKDNKSKRRKRTVAKNKRRKKTQKKKKINLQIGGNVEPIMARLLHTLERDIIEYLPSTKVVDTLQSEKHYLEMVDCIKLQEIINGNENFKKSPKIRKLFDYDLYEINDKDMYFVYKDFKCENIFKDVDKYYIYILYFYLMECNITRNAKIQQDGGGEEDKKTDEITSLPDDIPSDPDMPSKPDDMPSDPIPESEDKNEETTPQKEEDKPEGETPDDKPEGETPDDKPEEETPGDKPEGETPDDKPEGETPGDKPDEEKPDGEKPDEEQPDEEQPDEEKPDEEKQDEGQPNEEEDILEKEKKEMEEQKMEQEGEEKEEEGEEDMEEKIDIVNDIELPGFEEYEETRQKLDMKSDLVDGNIKITNSDLIKYKVDWFKVCMGIDIFDTGFENKVNTKLEELGIKPFQRIKYLEKIDLILNDKEMTSNFKNAIYERLMENCKEPEDFINNKKKCENPLPGPIDKFLGLFRKCHEQEMKDNGGILYLYDKYKTILNQNKTIINNVDMILIILNCEIRQRILSYHISVEIIRRRNVDNKTIKSILENIYEIDKPVIKQVEEELKNKIAQERLDRMKLIEQVNKEEIEMRKEQMLKKREPELINAILEKKKEQEQEQELEGQEDTMKKEDTKEIKNNIGIKDKDTDDFIGEHKNLLKNDILIGGRDVEGLDLESDMLVKEEVKGKSYDDIYDIYNNKTQSEFCNSINDVITKQHLRSAPLLNNCKSFK